MVDLVYFKDLFLMLENARFWRFENPEIPKNPHFSTFRFCVSFAKLEKTHVFHEKVTFFLFFEDFLYFRLVTFVNLIT